jgi:hypothetical protein
MRMRNKFNAQKIVTAEGVFDSHKEYERYLQLRLLERCGKIFKLDRQAVFTLIPAQHETYERYSQKTGKRLKDGKRCVEKACTYKADFVYYDDSGNQIVEDCKGYKKKAAYDLFTVKRKLMLYIHGIKVKEV